MKEINEKIKKFLGSKVLTKILYGIGILVLVSIIFHAGMVVGFRKASFGRDWGEHYRENFGRGGMPDRMKFGTTGYLPNAHGAIGKILEIGPSTLIVEDKDGTEKIILLKEDTRIEKVREKIKAENLAINDFVVIIGSPNSLGQIEAKFIRVVPNPESLNKENKNENIPK